jgi:hypothetical protein
MRNKYEERTHQASLRMLNEILSANKIKEKRSVVAKFNPHFYLMFQGGVKRYEQDDQSAEVAVRLDTDRDGLTDTQERNG